MTPASAVTAEELAAALGPLPLSQRAARAHSGGEHARRRTGRGSEFWQYRELQPGEASSRIDWRRSARSDDLYVREREEESPLRLLLWRDGSGSMQFSSRPDLPTKAARTELLLHALALAVGEAGEAADILGSPGRAATMGERLAEIDDAQPPIGAAGAGDITILAGDFLEPDSLADLGAAPAGLLLHIVDPAEADFAYRGRVRFVAAEAGDPEADVGRAESMNDRYNAAWTRHLAALDQLAATLNWPLVRHRTDEDPLNALDACAAFLRDGG